jgi:hypothetical protein
MHRFLPARGTHIKIPREFAPSNASMRLGNPRSPAGMSAMTLESYSL